MDPFSERRLFGHEDELGIRDRWLDLQAQHRGMAARLWAGMVASEFTDHELAVLDRSPVVSDHDRLVMRTAGRPMGRDVLQAEVVE